MSKVEQPSYTVDRSEGAIEVRAYPSLVVASTTIEGSRQAAIRQGFQILAGYIFGANDRSQKVEMTAPVMQEHALGAAAESTQAAENLPGVWTVRFVMPRSWTIDTLPIPKDKRVRLTLRTAATFAVIRFSGFGGGATLASKTGELEAFIAEHGLKAQSAPIYAFYNPPWTLPFFRRNEVMIEVIGSAKGYG